jgi:hypothetical protein
MARCVVWRAAQGRPRRPETRHAGQAPKPPGARTRPLGQELAQRRGARGLCFGIPLRAATQPCLRFHAPFAQDTADCAASTPLSCVFLSSQGLRTNLRYYYVTLMPCVHYGNAKSFAARGAHARLRPSYFSGSSRALGLVSRLDYINTDVFCNAFSGDLICPCRWIYLLWRSAAVNQAVKRHVLLSTSALGGAAGLARLSRSGSRRAGLCGRRRSWLAQRVCCRRRCSKSSDPALDPVPLAAARWLTRVLAAPPTGRPRESAPVERKARARVAG